MSQLAQVLECSEIPVEGLVVDGVEPDRVDPDAHVGSLRLAQRDVRFFQDVGASETPVSNDVVHDALLLVRALDIYYLKWIVRFSHYILRLMRDTGISGRKSARLPAGCT